MNLRINQLINDRKMITTETEVAQRVIIDSPDDSE